MLSGAVLGGALGAANDSQAVGGAAAGAAIGALVCAARAKDADNDGVRDDDDRCPGTFPGATVDQNGCELDFDGDGVVDRLDECPDTPSGVNVDSRGCELDDDGDGVVNSKDQCPGTPAGAAVDADGCELDSDGDGVLNSKDQCPNTAPGTAVDNNGCDLPPYYTLNGVYFEFDSARLTADSTAALDDALEILNRHEGLEVEIAGHTDSKGTDAYNQKLSERRADSVMQYLVDHGIDAGLLSAKGYGESEPIADNATDEGRAKNRRVEMRHK
ncbi:MAG: OmpA family protein [Xanthomonadales bacterium]|nr:OmpA family protein [Xanthomonadales bacterium]NIX12803.1 OmpA family protein [Xanthomonadales bacterium]